MTALPRAWFPISVVLCGSMAGCNAALGEFPEDAELRCENLILPAYPELVDGPELVFVERHTRYSDPDDPSRVIGFDLDEGVQCTPPPWSNPPRDRGPIDNLADVASIAAGKEWRVTAEQVGASTVESGRGTTLTRLLGYNGESFDPEVEIDLFEASTGEPGNRESNPPRWDGTDVWYASREYVVADGACWVPRLHTKARVENYTIVAEPFSDVVVLHDYRLQGTLVRKQVGWYLTDGLMGARWTIPALFREFARYGGVFCQPPRFYEPLRASYCSNLDMDTDADGVCDAISMGGAFEGYPARLGSVRDYPINECPPEKDPATIRCEQEPPP